MEFNFSADQRMKEKEGKKLDKYHDFSREYESAGYISRNWSPWNNLKNMEKKLEIWESTETIC